MSGIGLRTTFLLLLGCTGAFGASDMTSAILNLDGAILRVSGTCSVSSGKGASPAHPGDLLRTGDQLQCQQGNMFFHMGCTDQLLQAGSAPVTVTWARGKVPCNEKLIRSVYASHATEGGGRKGFETSSLFVLRWQPEKDQSLRFELREPNAEAVLWKSEAIDGASGSLESVSLRDALAAAQLPDTSRSLELRAVGAGARRATHFQLISSLEEQELKTELAAIEFIGGNAFFRLIARAATLKRHGLTADAAQAYDDALAMAPQSPILRERANEMSALTPASALRSPRFRMP